MIGSIGTMSLYGRETGIFDREEVELLSELVSDVAFALEYLEREDKAKFLAYYDPLTGLSNRDLFLDRLAQYLHSAGENDTTGIVLMDIERFSYVNEVYGRRAGDELLRSFSVRLQQVVEESGHLARIAANMFAIMLPDIRNSADVAHFIEQELLPQYPGRWFLKTMNSIFQPGLVCRFHRWTAPRQRRSGKSCRGGTEKCQAGRK
ncbi:MAG: sensor domain-containing diguanylate cyclase [Gammaproteobacteria bacterium]|nr:sensor domain-containing diguanylate cyclase [Gammaproteobacteria bacterium]